MSIDEDVKQLKEFFGELDKEIKNNPEKGKEFLIRAGIARKSKTHPSGIELVPELQSKA